MFSPRDRDAMIRTIAGEAANQGRAGWAAVGHTILNRTKDSRFPGSVYDVALQPQQFSAWNEGAGGNHIPSSMSNTDPMYQEIGGLVDELFAGQIPDPTSGATHYYAPAGMDALVASGSQTNRIPTWLGEENDRRGSKPVQIGGHIFTGAVQGGEDVQQPFDPNRIGNLLNLLEQGPGSGPALSFPSQAAQGFGDSQNAQAPALNGIPEGALTFMPQGGAGGDQGSENSDWILSNFGIERPKWLTKDRSETMLAFGTGLLSGDDWASGMAAAGENVLGVRRQRKEDQMAQDQMDQKFAQDLMLQTLRGQQAQQGQDRFLSPGNVMMSDGSIRADLAFNQATGRFTDASGADVTANVSQRVNNSDAYGSKGQMSMPQAQETQIRLESTHSTLKSMDRLLESMKTIDYGAEGFANDMSRFYNTLVGRGLTPEQIQRGIAAGDMQGLIGQTREQTVGPGVLTEQDAFRVLQALGGDINSILTNPEIVTERLNIARDGLLRTYNTEYDQYEAHRTKYPNLPYVEVERYMPSAPSLDQPNGDAGQAPEGMDPEDWKYLTPEQRKLWQ